MSEGVEERKPGGDEGGGRPVWALVLPVLVVLGSGASLWLGQEVPHAGAERAALLLVLLAGLLWTVLESAVLGRRLAQPVVPALPEPERAALPPPVPVVVAPAGPAPEWIELRQVLAELPRSTGLAVREALPAPEPPPPVAAPIDLKGELAPLVEVLQGVIGELRQGAAAAQARAEREHIEAHERAERAAHERLALRGLLEQQRERLAALEHGTVTGLHGLREALEEALLGVEHTVAERVTAVEQAVVEGLVALRRCGEEGAAALQRSGQEAAAGLERGVREELRALGGGVSALERGAREELRALGGGVSALERVTADGLGGVDRTSALVLQAVRDLAAPLSQPAREPAEAVDVPALLLGLRQHLAELVGGLVQEARASLTPLPQQIDGWLGRLEGQGAAAQAAAAQAAVVLREESDKAVQVFAGVAKNLDGTAGQIRELFFGAKAATDEIKRVRAALDAVLTKLQEQDKGTAQIAAQLQALGQDLQEMTDNVADLSHAMAEQMKNLSRSSSIGRADQASLVGALERVHRSIEKIASSVKKF